MTTTLQAVHNAMQAVKAVGKDGVNQHQRYNFRGIDGVLNAVGPAFREHGVVCTPTVINVEVERGTSPRGTLTTSVVATVDYVFRGVDADPDDVLTARVVAQAFDTSDKAYTKVMSVAYRTALIQVLALPTQEPDPDESHEELTNNPPQDPNDPANEARARLRDMCAARKVDPNVVVAFAHSEQGGGFDIATATGDEGAKRIYTLAKQIQESDNLVAMLRGQGGQTS